MAVVIVPTLVIVGWIEAGEREALPNFRTFVPFSTSKPPSQSGSGVGVQTLSCFVSCRILENFLRQLLSVFLFLSNFCCGGSRNVGQPEPSYEVLTPEQRERIRSNRLNAENLLRRKLFHSPSEYVHSLFKLILVPCTSSSGNSASKDTFVRVFHVLSFP